METISKGKAGQIGEIRTWAGKKYQKTAKGWRPVAGNSSKTGAKEPDSQPKPAENKSKSVEDFWKSIPEYRRDMMRDLYLASVKEISENPNKVIFDFANKFDKLYLKEMPAYISKIKSKLDSLDQAEDKKSQEALDFVKEVCEGAEKALDFINDKANELNDAREKVLVAKSWGWKVDNFGRAIKDEGDLRGSINLIKNKEGKYEGDFHAKGNSSTTSFQSDDLGTICRTLKSLENIIISK